MFGLSGEVHMTILLLVLIGLFISQGIYRNWGKRTFDALPPHIDEAEDWNGKDDDDHWYTKWRKSVKGWFAFGPRSAYKWARFRDLPITLFKIKGKGSWRYEASDGSWSDTSNHKWGYLSRVQYWTDWHIALQWPLFFHSHYKTRQFYIGLKRDADKVYWLACYPGGKVWK